MTVWLREHGGPPPRLSPVPPRPGKQTRLSPERAAHKQRQGHFIRKYTQQKTSGNLPRLAEWNFTHVFHLLSYLSVGLRSAKALGATLSGSADGLRYVQMRRCRNRKQVLYGMKSEEAIKKTQKSLLGLIKEVLSAHITAITAAITRRSVVVVDLCNKSKSATSRQSGTTLNNFAPLCLGFQSMFMFTCTFSQTNAIICCF